MGPDSSRIIINARAAAMDASEVVEVYRRFNSLHQVALRPPSEARYLEVLDQMEAVVSVVARSHVGRMS